MSLSKDLNELSQVQYELLNNARKQVEQCEVATLRVQTQAALRDQAVYACLGAKIPVRVIASSLGLSTYQVNEIRAQQAPAGE